MTGQYDENLILGYVEGDLTAEDRQRVEAMMQRDPALRELLDGLVADRAAVRALPREEPPAHLHEDVMQQLERSMLLGDSVTLRLSEERQHARRFHIGRVLMYSGLAAVVLITGGLVFYTLTDTGLVHDAAELQRSASVGQDEDTPDRLALGDTAAGWVEGDFAFEGLESRTARVDGEAQPAPAPAMLGRELNLNQSMQDVAAQVEAERSEVAAGRLDASPLAAAPAAPPAQGFFGVDAPAASGPAPAAAMEPMALTMREENLPTEAEPALALKAAEPSPDDQSLPGVEDRLSFFRQAAAAPAIERLIRSERTAEPVRIYVRARDAESARRDVVAWATRNGAVVLDPATTEAAPAGPFAGFTGGAREEEEALGERVIVQLTHQEQVPQLLAYLDRGDRRAGLVQTPAAPVDANYRVVLRRQGMQQLAQDTRTAESATARRERQAAQPATPPPASAYTGLTARPFANAEPDAARRRIAEPMEALADAQTDSARDSKLPGGALAGQSPHPRAEAYRGYGEPMAAAETTIAEAPAAEPPAAEVADVAELRAEFSDDADASADRGIAEPRSILEDPALLLQNVLPIREEDALRVPIYIQLEP